MSKIESSKDSQSPETLDWVKTNEDICTIKGDENENKSQAKPNLSVEKLLTEDSQVTGQSKLVTECTSLTAPSDTGIKS